MKTGENGHFGDFQNHFPHQNNSLIKKRIQKSLNSAHFTVPKKKLTKIFYGKLIILIKIKFFAKNA